MAFMTLFVESHARARVRARVRVRGETYVEVRGHGGWLLELRHELAVVPPYLASLSVVLARERAELDHVTRPRMI